MTAARPTRPELPIIRFATAQDWENWLAEHHQTAPGLWLQLAKKASGLASVSYDEALDVALCYGWIDGQRKSADDQSWLQKFTPRGSKSVWSKVNCGRVEALVAQERMQPSGLAAVEAAKQDGRWDAAYDSASRAVVPADFQEALEAYPHANAFFATLNRANRYAILYRIQTAKKPETRTKRIQQFIQMLENHEVLYS